VETLRVRYSTPLQLLVALCLLISGERSTSLSLPTRKNSLRLKHYDYAEAGAYFVTILAFRRLELFGKIQQGEVNLTPLGKLASSSWEQIPEHFLSIELDLFVIMPNHLHGILLLRDNTETRPNLSHVINTYKGAVTRNSKNLALDTPIWHRSFHDHIIRNQREYDYIARYIHTNPLRWEEDSLKGELSAD
jgi:putative transposase